MALALCIQMDYRIFLLSLQSDLTPSELECYSEPIKQLIEEQPSFGYRMVAALHE